MNSWAHADSMCMSLSLTTIPNTLRTKLKRNSTRTGHWAAQAGHTWRAQRSLKTELTLEPQPEKAGQNLCSKCSQTAGLLNEYQHDQSLNVPPTTRFPVRYENELLFTYC